MERSCRFVPLSKQPLVLVLAQVRFSPVRRIDSYIPEIQEDFRRHGFPLERAGKVQQLRFGPGGGPPIEVFEQQRWEYRTKDETQSVLVTEDSVVLQTTSYDRFETFAETLLRVLRTVLAKSEHDTLGIIQRVGLRYIDLVRPREGEDFRLYLRPGFHGVADEVFHDGTHRLHVESRGWTSVDDVSGRMVIRITQNDRGFALPPDLLGGAPEHAPRAKRGELVTLIDMDHFIEGKFDADADWVVEKAYGMHDHLIETFHERVVTPDAIEAWK
jgi:uncharacterized protein (TIGR04255 family)